MYKIVNLVVLTLVLSALPALPALADASRDATRERLRATLTSYGQSDAGVTFHQSVKAPYNFVGSMTTGLKYAQSMEIVVSVTDKQTIGFRVYPHYNGGYINVLKAKDSNGLMKKLLYFSDQNFLYWGADDTYDCFAGYTFTLESGYPEEAIRVVLRSLANQDQFVGQMIPYL
jgi:hypothetical protein